MKERDLHRASSQGTRVTQGLFWEVLASTNLRSCLLGSFEQELGEFLNSKKLAVTNLH